MSVFRKTILQNPNADRVLDIKIYGSGTTIFDVAGSAGLEFNTESTGGLNFKIGGSAGLYINDNISGTPTSCGGFQLDLRGGGGTILFKNGIGTDIYSTLNLDANNNFSLSGVDNSGLGKALGITGSTTAGLFLSNNVDSTSISLLMTGDSGSIVLNASGTGSGIDIDSNNGISVENQTAGNIYFNNAGGTIEIRNSTSVVGSLALWIYNEVDGKVKLENKASTNGGIEIMNENNGNILIFHNSNVLLGGNITIETQSATGSILIANSNGGSVDIQQAADDLFKINHTGTGAFVMEHTGTGPLSIINTANLDNTVGIYIQNSGTGDIDITNAGGDVRLTPKDGSPVILEKRQVRTTKSIINTDSPYSAADELYILADTSAGVITVNLPAAVAGLIYKIKNSDTTSAGNAVTVAPAAGTIDGAANATLNALEAKEFVCDGTNWWII